MYPSCQAYEGKVTRARGRREREPVREGLEAEKEDLSGPVGSEKRALGLEESRGLLKALKEEREREDLLRSGERKYLIVL